MPPKPDRVFRDAWLQHQDLRGWIAKIPGNRKRAYCNVCRVDLSAEISALKRHSRSASHMKRREHPPVDHEAEEEGTSQTDTDKIARAEIKLATFMAEHNISFNTADHLVDVLKDIFPDSAIAQNITLKRSKATYIVKDIASVSHNELTEDLKKNKYSIIIDETTDISTSKTCAVLCKYYDRDRNTINTRLLDLLEIYKCSDVSDPLQGSTGENLFQLITNYLEKHNIPVENLVGFASDNASNIMGPHNSLVSRLRNIAPNITILRCICHSVHLCASYAAKTLPRMCEDLVRNIYTYFCHSAKRKSEFQQFQSFCEVKPHKILHISQTRWLSLHMAVQRILEQWNPLMLFFQQQYLEEKLTCCSLIHDGFKDPSVRFYFHFLNFILPKFTEFNKLFQRADPTIHLLYNACKTLYIDVLRLFYKHEYLHVDPMHIDPEKEEHYLPLEQVYLGADVHRLLQTPEYSQCKALVSDVKKRCVTFLATACTQMRSRFPLESTVLKHCSALSVRKCLSKNFLLETPTLADLVSEVPRIYNGNVQDLDAEWRRLPDVELPLDLRQTNNSEQFFRGLRTLTNENGEPMFSVLPQFALNVLALPTSNADAERIFSKTGLIKSKIRNKLLPSTQAALVQVSEIVKMQGGCVAFQPTPTMITSVKHRGPMAMEVEENDV